eukprot:CAMPEP_0181182050 /NCGR_PEP_ID=MMETSP1096-20121128/7673_1 /TAXON_ID=156174 ORGANISM="Chrysochromulina ericina, Strain CCMP281" /NCGR_SAMPLE_ID=MMETSP1096 /ASSEMBLY_ACC=CAM_ASM_000453 /LENGTH=192 /DNA_ID=CAMNT_0023270613 /DNA_START=39 /DNA_END=617 /DNA_ORIENTATION=+
MRIRPMLPTPLSPLMLAKSKKPDRKKKKAAPVSRAAPPSVAKVPPTSAQPPLGEPAMVDDDASVEERVARVLRESGLAPEGGAPAAASAPSDPLSRIPLKGQALLERFFAGGALTFGTIFLTAGILVSAEALAKVLGYDLPVAIDEALIQYVEPAMTPSILILFGFSISLGLLKQLQLGSESAGVLYTEDDD